MEEAVPDSVVEIVGGVATSAIVGDCGWFASVMALLVAFSEVLMKLVAAETSISQAVFEPQ